jgi:outer membrane receptor protein involved in Fe transport
LQQNPVQRGVRLLLDGLPVNLADGSFIIGVLEPRTTQYIEVYRGANGARYGATTLGGAINFIAPTGYDHGFSRTSLEGGGFGFINALAATGGQLGNGDYFAGLTHNQRDGYRDYSESNRQSFSANYGLRQADWESRFFLNYVNLDFEVPGPLPKATLESDPESVHGGPVVIPNPGGPPTVTQPGPNVPRDRPERKVEQARLANRTTLLLSNTQEIDAGFSYLRTDDTFRFPVSTGVVESLSDDLAAELRYRRLAPVAERENRFELGMNASWGQIGLVYNYQDFHFDGDPAFGDNALGGAPEHLLSQDLSGFIAAGGTVYISPYTLRHFAASPEMLADGVTVPKDPPAVHRHMFDPTTQLVVW